MTLRVGMIHYGLDRQTGGIGRYTAELAAALAQQGVTVFPLWAGARPPQAGGVSLPGAYLLPGLLTVGQAGIAWQAQRLGLDLVHDPTGAMPHMLTRVRHVAILHDVIPYVYPETSTRLDWLIYRLWLPLAVRRLDALITISTASRNDILKYLSVDAKKLTIIPLAAATSYRPLNREVVDQVLHRYGVQQPFILTVSSLESRKNLSRLLEAYAQLRNWSTRWSLVIVGARKWKYSEIFATVRRLELEPHVLFTGYVEEADLPAFYNGADLFVFPSLYEGFGLPVVEAMACGTPVITSNVSSLPEVAGDAALLIDPYDVTQIAHAMALALTQPTLAAMMKSKGMARAAQFSWERTARETLSVYEQIMKQ